MKTKSSPHSRLELDLVAFAQSPKFLSNWQGLVDGSSQFAGFNWSSFLFGPAWFIYRKLYLQGIALCVLASLAVTFMARVIAVLSPDISTLRIAGVLIVLMIVLVRLPVALYANVAYFKRGVHLIHSAHSQGLDQHTKTAFLQHRGGTDVRMLVLLTLCYGLMQWYRLT